MSGKATDAELIERLKLLKEHNGNRTKAALALGVSASTYRTSIRDALNRGLTANSKVIDETARLKQELKLANKRLELTQQETETAERIREEIFKIAARDPAPPPWLHQTGAPGKRGTPMTIWSDFHYGEVINRDEVGGVNAYNKDIAKKRLTKLVNTTIDLAYNHMGRAKTEYPGIVICLGGDMIGGDIHEELAKTNDRTSNQSVEDLTDMLAGAIDTMAGKFGKAFVPCVVGNHSRTTKRMQMKQRVYCVEKTTPILTNDLRWVPAEELSFGSPILAFEEHAGRQGRCFQKAVITHSKIKKAQMVKLSLGDGTTLTVTPEHKLLGHGGQNNSAATWISAADFARHIERGRKNYVEWTVDRFLPVWEEDRSYEAGLLAGAFDSEGCLSRTNGTLQLSFNQVQNVFLEQVKDALIKLGFAFSAVWDYRLGDELERQPRCAIYIKGGLGEIARFLGTIRPLRLLQKWAEFDISTACLYREAEVPVVSAEYVEGDIAELSSSSKTYLSAGYASHNTSWEWNIYCNLIRHFRTSKHVQFAVPSETDILFRVYGHRYLLSHGDSMGVKGGDGIIGALGPIKRGSLKVHRSEAQIGRDFDTLVIGHWHQYITLPGLIVNNSFKGYDEYARLTLRAEYSRPSQALWFTHPEHGVTAHWQVYLEGLQTANDDKQWVGWQEKI